MRWLLGYGSVDIERGSCQRRSRWVFDGIFLSRLLSLQMTLELLLRQ